MTQYVTGADGKRYRLEPADTPRVKRRTQPKKRGSNYAPPLWFTSFLLGLGTYWLIDNHGGTLYKLASGAIQGMGNAL